VIVKMIVEKQMECRLAGETEVLGGNLPQRHFCPLQNPTWPDPGLNPDRRGGKPATNRLSYGAALALLGYLSASISSASLRIQSVLRLLSLRAHVRNVDPQLVWEICLSCLHVSEP
jgi:hypothetical protein